METTTKYEREQQAQQERAKRATNIAAIQKDIDECESLIAVVPASEWKDLFFLQSRRGWLYSMLDDEQKAYNKTFSFVSAEEIQAFLRGLGN